MILIGNIVQMIVHNSKITIYNILMKKQMLHYVLINVQKIQIKWINNVSKKHKINKLL